MTVGALVRIAAVISVCNFTLIAAVRYGVASQAVIDDDPARAIALAPNLPEALVAQATSLMLAHRPVEAFLAARQAVLGQPYDVVALRIAAQAAKLLGRDAESTALFRQAGGLGWRDPPTQAWMIEDAARRGDVDEIMQRADALERRQLFPELTRPVFFAAFVDPRMRKALVDRIGEQPSWRRSLFADMYERLTVAQAAGFAAFLQDMAAQGEPASPAEIAMFVDRLAKLQLFDEAQRVRHEFLGVPSAQLTQTPFDGGFSRSASGSAAASRTVFEWHIDGAATNAEIDDGGLRVTSGAGGVPLVAQMVLLTAGPHILRAQVTTSPPMRDIAGWSISCLPGSERLPLSGPAGHGPTLALAMFDIPTGDMCRAQMLTLRSFATEDGITATIDNVAIH